MRPRPICVVLPARDEAATIGAALAALAVAARTGVDPRAVQVLVVANNCADDTAARARAVARAHPWFRLEVQECELAAAEANIGTARRLAMDEAARRLPVHGVIASTDADSVVAPDWLAATLAEIERGADLVGGRIRVRFPAAADPRLRRIYLADTAYRLLATGADARLDPDPADPWPRHFQHFGASLAVTRAAYLAVGGLPRVPWLEDMAFVDALRREDRAIRHSPAVRVTTSARLAGRVGVGLSTQLGEWQALAERGEQPLVESAVLILARARERSRLRECWERNRAWRQGITFGRFAEIALAGIGVARPPVQPLPDAIAGLRSGLAELRRIDGLPPFEQVEPVGLGAVPAQMAERLLTA